MRRLWMLVGLSVVGCDPVRVPNEPALEPSAANLPTMVVVPKSAPSVPGDAPTEPVSEPRAEPTVDEAEEDDHEADEGPHDAGGETDMARRGLQMYNMRVVRFFKHGFRCPTASSCEPSVHFELDGTGVVTKANVTPCGDAAIDNIVAQHASGKVGLTVPPPPEAYASARQTKVKVSYVCR